MTRLITREGFKKLQDELDHRRTTVRQEIAKAIKEAKEQGDLSENAEYAEAKHQQTNNENRIAELEVIIKDCEVVKRDKSAIGIQVGSKVKTRYDGNEMEFQIVGSNEANPTEMKISNESPMGKAFMGRVRGNIVDVETPNGKKMRYEILDVI